MERATINLPSLSLCFWTHAQGFSWEAKAGRRWQGSHRWLLQNICYLSPWGSFAEGQYCICKALLALEMHLEKCSHALCIYLLVFLVQRRTILGCKIIPWREVFCSWTEWTVSKSLGVIWVCSWNPGFALGSKAADSGELSTAFMVLPIMGRRLEGATVGFTLGLMAAGALGTLLYGEVGF